MDQILPEDIIIEFNCLRCTLMTNVKSIASLQLARREWGGGGVLYNSQDSETFLTLPEWAKLMCMLAQDPGVNLLGNISAGRYESFPGDFFKNAF